MLKTIINLLVSTFATVLMAYCLQESFFRIFLSENDLILTINCTWFLINLFFSFILILDISFRMFLNVFFDLTIKNKNIEIEGKMKVKKR